MKYTYKLLLLFVGVLLLSCDARKDEDVEPIGTTEFLPEATVTADVSEGQIEQGTMITYAIELDKPFAYPTQFKATLAEGSSEGIRVGQDVVLGTTKIAAYTTSTEITVSFPNDGFPQETLTAKIIIEPTNATNAANLENDLSTKVYTYELLNVNSNEGLTVGMNWNQDQATNIDVVAYDSEGSEHSFVATGDVPEVEVLILNTDADGTYYVGIDPYELIEEQFEFNFGLHKPNGETVSFEGVFDNENLEQYTADVSPSLETDTYRLLKIVKTGSDYTISQLP